MIKTIVKDVTAKIEVKKSQFIANIFQVNSEEEAKNKIAEIKKTHRDARHNCFGYVIEQVDEEGKINHIEKFSDDGEPSGTAGTPILDILKKQKISNVVVIVTRYFGGILLGTGGLVKAYSDATKLVIDNSEFINKEAGILMQITIAYNYLKNLEYICKNNDIRIINIQYGENVVVELAIASTKIEIIENANFEILDSKVKNKNIYVMV